MLCNICKSLNFVAAASGNDWNQAPKHHSSLENLREAAHKGCQLCRAILSNGKSHSFRRYDPSAGEEELEQIYYHAWDSGDQGPEAPYHGATNISFYQKGNVERDEWTGFSFYGYLFAKDGNLSISPFFSIRI